jgi:hypothetical protein
MYESYRGETLEKNRSVQGHPAIDKFSLETLSVNGHFCGVTQLCHKSVPFKMSSKKESSLLTVIVFPPITE